MWKMEGEVAGLWRWRMRLGEMRQVGECECEVGVGGRTKEAGQHVGLVRL